MLRPALLAAMLLAATLVSAWDLPRLHSAAQRLGPAAQAALPALEALRTQLASVDDIQRLELVNRHFNERIAFRTDAQSWQREDHWATPLEALGRGQGDCEDYAVAKYALLRAAGVPLSRLRLVYVSARLAGPGAPASPQPHMVLAYEAAPGAEPLILDNLRPEVLPAGQRPDLSPVFSFNDEGLWAGAGAQRAGDPLRRLSPWRTLLERLRQEGW